MQIKRHTSNSYDNITYAVNRYTYTDDISYTLVIKKRLIIPSSILFRMCDVTNKLPCHHFEPFKCLTVHKLRTLIQGPSAAEEQAITILITHTTFKHSIIPTKFPKGIELNTTIRYIYLSIVKFNQGLLSIFGALYTRF